MIYTVYFKNKLEEGYMGAEVFKIKDYLLFISKSKFQV